MLVPLCSGDPGPLRMASLFRAGEPHPPPCGDTRAFLAILGQPCEACSFSPGGPTWSLRGTLQSPQPGQSALPKSPG